MYPELDEAIYNALDSSTEKELNPFIIRLPGKEQLNADLRSIIIGNTGNKLETQGEDYDARRISYDLLVDVESADYLEAKQELRDVEVAIKKTLRKSLDPQYSDLMQIDDVLPQYAENEPWGIYAGVIQISFLVYEDYADDVDEFTDIKIRGELK
ncbi:hypothetical protein [Methanobacterium sp.]|uniref:hypothetical protein n=1 Tax=Methanobacterium sp. TaxID=2164 RepID=UPI003C7217F8